MDSSPSIEALNLLLYAMLKSGQIKETIEEINFWMKPFPSKVKVGSDKEHWTPGMECSGRFF